MATALFVRLLDLANKNDVLAQVVKTGQAAPVFAVAPSAFKAVPGAPFCYWASPTLRACFSQHEPLERGEGRFARRTNSVDDDFRFVRLFWEKQTPSCHWPWAKGGAHAPYYFDITTYMPWDNARRTYPGFLGTRSRPMERPASSQHFFRPGLTWPRRTNGLSFRVMPAGSIFADKGPAAFIEDDEPTALLALCALINSAPFGALVALQLARTELAQSFEVGLIQQTPVPNLTTDDQTALATLAHRAWSLKRIIDTRVETSHAFHLPALLQTSGTTLAERSAAWEVRVATNEAEQTSTHAEIDDRCFALYGISDQDRRSIEQGFGGDSMDDADPSSDDSDGEDTDTDPAETDATMAANLASWAIGVTTGRFDLRLATGERTAPPEPDPFAPLPPCSPGMLTGDVGLPLAAPPPGYPIGFPTDGILVDDPGADRDLLARVRQVFGVVFGEHGDERLQEAREAIDPGADDLRPWLRAKFFEAHIKRYSKSRRKAPIYWQLGTPSASYSVWLTIHRTGRDTLHAVLRDHVIPKLRYETNRLATLRAEAGDSPAPSQRKAIDAQEAFLDELRDFRDELQRVAPLWDPDLDDGVVINASFLHRLFAHTRSWQQECEGHWNKLCAGDYDWAHLAMRLWPERVVPKCCDDRSLAIAHGLEEALWFQDESDKWQPRAVSDAQIASLVQERSSPAVKDALAQLATAPAQKPARRTKARKPKATARRTPRPTAPAAQLSLPMAPASSSIDKATLDALRAALHGFPDGAARAELLAASGIDEATWKPAIDALVDRGEVERTGKAKGTRYRLASTPAGAR